MVKRIFVEKKKGYEIEAKGMFNDLKENLKISALKELRVIVRYDVEGVNDEYFNMAKTTIFSEPQIDVYYDETFEIPSGMRAFAYELLPGQYDQRADFAAQCLQLLTQEEKPIVRAAKLVVVNDDISDADFEKIKAYSINPVEACESTLDKPESLAVKYDIPDSVPTIEGFIDADDDGLKKLIADYGLAMDFDDIKMCQDYFKNTEKRNPTHTEIKMIDTYWSDHCRHTTFLTKLENVEINDEKVKEVYDDYLSVRKDVYGDRKKNICFMDIATIAMKKLKKDGVLKALDESEEINACSIKVDVDVDGVVEPWLLMFKNETHNHPTEIEPFGGAATCLGGAIRDPLSGRSYVYQAMRVTGSGDPRTTVADTMKGKLPQRKITTTAAQGYSSYGNQIGLSTGLVDEVYDEGYVAKRMEIGAVIGAAPAYNVIREVPTPGDIVILLGGRTGRDGCGGATGSSKAHTEKSLESCGAEVQKGNPPEERKIQRLFRNSEVTRLIKRCNDFGAGGVSVAVGELADGLTINLDAVPKKYEGLTGTELAISESQERMAVVIRKEDKEKFIALASAENIEATEVAEVTDANRMVMLWNGVKIVDISRDFLNTNGAEKQSDAVVAEIDYDKNIFKAEKIDDLKKKCIDVISSLNVCSKKGLVERFDSSIGASSVLMPYGGKYRLTPTQVMAAKLPVKGGKTNTASLMSYGYSAKLSKWSPFHGSMYAVLESVAKIVSAGGNAKDIYLTFQEYFERLNDEKTRWGKPFASLLGGYYAQLQLGIAAIGGKDSMSGSFMDISVPPTLVSFAVTTEKADKIISPEFKKSGSKLVLVDIEKNDKFIPDFEDAKTKYAKVYELIQQGKILSAFALGEGGIFEAVAKMSFGNKIGCEFSGISNEELFVPKFGALLLEVSETVEIGKEIGTTGGETVCGVSIDELVKNWSATLEGVFPTVTDNNKSQTEVFSFDKRNTKAPAIKVAKPKVFIPVFPGTNCEYDTASVFEKAGAETDIFVIKNLTPSAIEESVAEMKKRIDNSQIVMLAGGFSAGDEPDGSGKFIATVFRNPVIKECVNELLNKRDGLMLGICNGFQALIKLGLVPYGEIRDMDANCPTLTYNTIGRHVSSMVYTRVSSTLSPWLANTECGDIHSIAVSHGEGRFVADEALIRELAKNGQIATQYVDLNGNATYDIEYNPNGSICAVEGITSPDGRVLGKMGHSERIGNSVAKNIFGNKDQKIFEAGVNYFK